MSERPKPGCPRLDGMIPGLNGGVRTSRSDQNAEQEDMMDKDRALLHLREALGHKPLTRPWAKAEILLGLFAASLGDLPGRLGVRPGR